LLRRNVPRHQSVPFPGGSPERSYFREEEFTITAGTSCAADQYHESFRGLEWFNGEPMLDISRIATGGTDWTSVPARYPGSYVIQAAQRRTSRSLAVCRSMLKRTFAVGENVNVLPREEDQDQQDQPVRNWAIDVLKAKKNR